MATLARSIGLAKGTLYLYFHTREEVFLALCDLKTADWAERLSACLEPGLTDLEFCEAYFATAHDDAALLPLLMRLNAIIEHNVSVDALITAKRSLRNRVAQLAQAVSQTLALTPEQSLEAVSVLAQFLIGAAQADKGPSLEQEDLPADVREFIDSFDAHRTFVPNACRILRGIRAGD